MTGASKIKLGIGREGRRRAPSPRASLTAFRHHVSASGLQNNLPAQITSFIGRARQISEVKDLLCGSRLLTISGAGGVGKTRLALEVAVDVAKRFPDGVWFSDLAALSEPELVPETVAGALGIPEQSGRGSTETLKIYLGRKTVLLVLDNCEHLLASCAHLVTALLEACPKLRVLATSREALGITGELTYRVPSLSLPDAHAVPKIAHITRHEATRLFVERAKLADPGFRVTESNAAAVAHLCTRLDGIPLAIELAAARVKSLSIEQIVSRLDQRFSLLTGGSRTALPRQQTLRATMDWSYGLLGTQERRVLHQLSAFVGGWTLAAAEAVCACNGIVRADVLDLLTSLVQKSLVIMDTGSDGARYRFLETVRQYGLERLEHSGEAGDVRMRHRDWCLAIAEEAAGHYHGPREEHRLRLLEPEHDNIRAAIAWSHAEPDGIEAELRLCIALHRFWFVRGYWSEGRQWLEAALSRSGHSEAPNVARALEGAALMASLQGDYGRAILFGEKSVALFRRMDDDEGVVRLLNYLGGAKMRQGDYEGPKVMFEEALALSRRAGAKWWGTAMSLAHLGLVARIQGNHHQAAVLLHDSLALFKKVGHKHRIAYVLYHLGVVTLRQHDYPDASALFKRSIDLCREVGEKWITVYNLEGLAQAGSAQRQYRQGARLLGAAEALRETLGLSRFPADQAAFDQCIASTRLRLGKASFEAAWAQGATMTLDQAIQDALDVPDTTQATRRDQRTQPPSIASNPLTTREQDVAGLVARGLTNREIATSLAVTERTSETHVQNILNKLGFTRRSQIASWAAEQGLHKSSEP